MKGLVLSVLLGCGLSAGFAQTPYFHIEGTLTGGDNFDIFGTAMLYIDTNGDTILLDFDGAGSGSQTPTLHPYELIADDPFPASTILFRVDGLCNPSAYTTFPVTPYTTLQFDTNALFCIGNQPTVTSPWTFTTTYDSASNTFFVTPVGPPIPANAEIVWIFNQDFGIYDTVLYASYTYPQNGIYNV